jgi:arylsulfatase A-like enzyme
VEPQIIDLAPTALYLLGLPVPEDMDGRVLTEIIEPGYVAEHPVLYGDAATTSTSDNSYSPEEAELVRDQLRALGYLD